MDKLASRLSRTIQNFQKRFETILEQDPREGDRDDADISPFEPSRDPSLIRGLSIGLPDDHVDRAIVLFSRLSMHFDAGVLLESFDASWKSQAVFARGRVRVLPPSSSVNRSLPSCQPLQALKAPHPQLVKALHLESLDPRPGGTCLLVKPVPDYAYLLISHWPDLWLRDHTESVIAALASAFSDCGR